MRSVRAAIVAATALAAPGCGGHGTFRDWQWTGEHTSFRVGPLPPAWRRVKDAEADVQFVDPSTGAVILANAECGTVRDAPLEVLANTILFGFTDRRFRAQSPATLGGLPALRSVADAKLDGQPVVVESYVAKTGACVYDVAWVAPAGAQAASDREAFEKFASGFQAAR